MKLKLAGIFFIVLLAFVYLLVGITVINAKEGHKYTKQVLSQSQQQYTNKTIPFKRGTITDRNGTVLANSIKVYNLILDCKAVNFENDSKEQPYREPTLDALETYFGVDREEVEALLDGEETRESQYQILKKEVSMEDKKEFEERNGVPETEEEQKALGKEELARRRTVQGIYFEDTYKRVYPMETLACDVIGFTDAGNTASWGLEGYYNSTLNGTDGRKFGYFNDDSTLEQTIIDEVNGKNLTTTLDATIQEIVEKYIDAFDQAMSKGPRKEKGKKARGAENIGVIVENPNNGEILAMASSDPYDLNNPRELSGIYTEKAIEEMDDEEVKNALFAMWRNYCIAEDYELGSVYKPVVVASALEAGSVSADDEFVCDGGQQIGTDYVRCAVYPDSHGTQSLGEVIQNSCNDGMMAVARSMGAATFLEYQTRFNFGTRTGIDLPGEGTGLLFTQENMNEMELATSAFGQGFTATMIQEIAAISAVVNGGTYYQPHLVKEITDEDGKVIKSIAPKVMKEVISPDVSAELRKYMGMSVESGTSHYAKVQGYSMGGKTGTAEKLKQAAELKEEGSELKNYLVSFVGFAPLDDPEVVVYVVVDTPNTDNQAASQYAQYIAQAVFQEILPYMNVYPDEETEAVTELWEGFSGVPKLTDIEEDGISNPHGALAGEDSDKEGEEGENENSGEGELNDQYTDGITNEEAGYDEESSEESDYGEDSYNEEGEYTGGNSENGEGSEDTGENSEGGEDGRATGTGENSEDGIYEIE